MDNIVSRTNNVSVSDRSRKKFEVFALRTAAASDISNDQIKPCNVCRNRGFHHEPISFEKVLGRVLSDGSNETKSWILMDYFTGRQHIHRSKIKEVSESNG